MPSRNSASVSSSPTTSTKSVWSDSGYTRTMRHDSRPSASSDGLCDRPPKMGGPTRMPRTSKASCAAACQHCAAAQRTQTAHRNTLGGVSRGNDAALRASGLRLRGKRRRLHAFELCVRRVGCEARQRPDRVAARDEPTHSSSPGRTAPARPHAFRAPPPPWRPESKPAAKRWGESCRRRITCAASTAP